MPAGITLGDCEITLIRDSVYWWDGGAIFGVVPKTLWSKHAPADELNRIAVAFNCYLIRTGDHTILVETGGGDKMDARARERMKLPSVSEPLPEVVARHGVDPESIDIVINSHLHWDHCGGNTLLRGGHAVAAFPRARYFASRPEWEHAHERLARDRVSYIDANYDPLVESGRMTLVEPDCEVAPGVWMRRAPGHNRDMCIVTASSGGKTFGFLTDLAPSAAHVTPTWVAAFDLYPLESIESKTKFLSQAAEENWICGFGHDTAVDFARVEREKSQFRAVPV
jgi:glyoxylase-like metal-dependent hydrolase (beta-lactamase superfamily II)